MVGPKPDDDLAPPEAASPPQTLELTLTPSPAPGTAAPTRAPTQAHPTAAGASGGGMARPFARAPMWAVAKVVGLDSDDPITRALALEAAALPADAQAALRNASRAGLGDRGVEAGRRADALAELEQAASMLLRGQRGPARTLLASAKQTLERQRAALAWSIAPALAARMGQVAATASDRKLAAALLPAAADGLPAALGRAALAAKASLREGRCLGSSAAADAAAMVRMAEGPALVVGTVGRGDEAQVGLWLVDNEARALRQGSFGAAGADVGLTAITEPGGAWIGGQTRGAHSADGLLLRIDGRLRPVAQHDLDLGGDEQVIAFARSSDGGLWALIEGEVGDPAGPHRGVWLVAVRPDATPRTQVLLPLPRPAFAAALRVDSGNGLLLAAGGRGPGEAAGAFLRAVDAATVRVQDGEGPAFPGPIFGLQGAPRGALAAFGAAGEGKAMRPYVVRRDLKGRWGKPAKFAALPAFDHLAVAPAGNATLLLLAAQGTEASPGPGVVALVAGARPRVLLSLPGFWPAAALVEGKDAWVAGSARGCGRLGLDAAVIRLRL